ncbi:MAG: hypothetical protein V1892_03185 [bacterium]
MAKFIPRSLLRYLTPVLISFLIFLGLEFFFIFPKIWALIALFLFLVNFIAIWQLIPKTTQARLILNSQKFSLKLLFAFFRIITDREFINFLLPTLFLNLGSIIFLIFLPVGLFRHLVALFTAFLSFLFFKSLFLYFFRPEEYQARSLENVSLYLSLITFYFFSSSFLGLIIFADFLLWQALLIYLAVTFLLVWQVFWVHQFEVKNSWYYIFILCLLAGEFFWAINFLPLNFYVGGLLLAVIYYLFFSLSRRQLTGALEKKIVWHYLLLSLAIILIILATAEWR